MCSCVLMVETGSMLLCAAVPVAGSLVVGAESVSNSVEHGAIHRGLSWDMLLLACSGRSTTIHQR